VESSVAQNVILAQADLVTAQKALDDLLNSTLQQAQAMQAVEDAQNTLADLNRKAAEESAQAQLDLANAEDALEDQVSERGRGDRHVQELRDVGDAAPNGLDGLRLDLVRADVERGGQVSEVGVDAKVGDYVLEIDGQELMGDDNPYRLLRHKTDPVTLTLSSKPGLEGARKTTYRPITSEEALLYLDFVTSARAKVATMTSGRAGYIHIPDMGAAGSYEFLKWFYPQIRREGMVVDVRSNGGGNVSQWLIERLDTKMLGTRFDRIDGYPDTYPATTFHGQKVCLLNETSASDGDIFPYYFRESGLGPLIGTRTWGGLVHTADTPPFVDGGSMIAPRGGFFTREGTWAVENEGVGPDIDVENWPKDVIAGHDPQLERAVQEALRLLKEHPPDRATKEPPSPTWGKRPQ